MSSVACKIQCSMRYFFYNYIFFQTQAVVAESSNVRSWKSGWVFQEGDSVENLEGIISFVSVFKSTE